MINKFFKYNFCIYIENIILYYIFIMIINLNINNLNEITFNSNTTELSQQYIKLNENSLNMYIDTNYNIYFNQTTNNEIYYYVFTSNHKIYNKTIIENGISYNYYYGIIEPIFDTNTFKINKTFLDNEKQMKYSYYLFKLSKDNNNNYLNNTYIKSGIIILEKPLIYLKCVLNNEKLLLDLSNDMTKNNSNNIKIINKYDTTKSIVLYYNYNYLINITNNKNIHIYNELFEDYDKISQTITGLNSEFIKIEKQIYKWKIIDNLNSYTGNLIIDDFSINDNSQILEDMTFRDINILTKLYYNEFTYPEHKNIIKINNITNYLNSGYSNKLLIIDNINSKKIDIILPSSNVFVGIVFKIVILTNLVSINIKFEDNELNLDNYDHFKGSINISNINISNINIKKNKTLIPDYTVSNTKRIIDTTNNIVINNNGLNKYGYIELYCNNKINNNYCWNIIGKLLNNNNNNNINNVFI